MIRKSMNRLFHLVRCNRYGELNTALAENYNRYLVHVSMVALQVLEKKLIKAFSSAQARDNIGYTLTHLGMWPCALS